MSPAFAGPALLALAALLSSLGGAGFALAAPVHPLAVNAVRCLTAAGVSAVFFAADRRLPRLCFSTAWGGLCLALTTQLFALAAPLAGAGTATLLLNTSPLFVLLVQCAAQKKPPRSGQLQAAVLVIGGVAVVAGCRPGPWQGLAAGLASGACYAGVFLAGQGPKADPASAFFWGQLLAGLADLPFLAASQPLTWPARSWAAGLVLGLVQLGLCYRCMAKGLAITPPLTASLVCTLEPVLAPLWGLWAGQRLPGGFWLGTALVLAGILRQKAVSLPPPSTGGSAPAPAPSRGPR